MVEDHRRAAAVTNKVDQAIKLEVIQPGIEGETALAKATHPAAECRVSAKIGLGSTRDAVGLWIIGAGQMMTNAAEPSASCSFVCVQHIIERIKAQVGSRNDPSDYLTTGLVSSIGHEPGFPHRCHRIRVRPSICRAAFNKHGGGDTMTIAKVTQ